MKKFIEFSYHDYHDMRPTKEVLIMEEENVQDYLKYINEVGHGPTSLVKVYNKQEAIEHLCHELKECLSDTHCPDEQNLEEALKVFSKNTFEQFFECYGRDHVWAARRAAMQMKRNKFL